MTTDREWKDRVLGNMAATLRASGIQTCTCSDEFTAPDCPIHPASAPTSEPPRSIDGVIAVLVNHDDEEKINAS